MLDMLPGITNTRRHARTHAPTEARRPAATLQQSSGYGIRDTERTRWTGVDCGATRTAVSVGRFGGLRQSFCPGGLLSAAVQWKEAIKRTSTRSK